MDEKCRKRFFHEEFKSFKGKAVLSSRLSQEFKLQGFCCRACHIALGRLNIKTFFACCFAWACCNIWSGVKKFQWILFKNACWAYWVGYELHKQFRYRRKILWKLKSLKEYSRLNMSAIYLLTCCILNELTKSFRVRGPKRPNWKDWRYTDTQRSSFGHVPLYNMGSFLDITFFSVSLSTMIQNSSFTLVSETNLTNFNVIV